MKKWLVECIMHGRKRGVSPAVAFVIESDTEEEARLEAIKRTNESYGSRYTRVIRAQPYKRGMTVKHPEEQL